MQKTTDQCLRSVLCLVCFSLSSVLHGSELKQTQVSRADLCVTEGEIGTTPSGWLSVNVPKMRAYLNAKTPPAVELRFRYQGSTGNVARLGSGELRRQLGLKLRVQDACNLVYAMWRIEPESKLVVSVKTNPGQHTSSQCSNRGYRNIKPRRSRAIPHLRPGDTHTLRAEMRGEEMRVLIDGDVVWEGEVGRDALAFDGPVGIRSDNAKLEFELRSAPPLKPHFEPAGCKSGDSD